MSQTIVKIGGLIALVSVLLLGVTLLNSRSRIRELEVALEQNRATNESLTASNRDLWTRLSKERGASGARLPRPSSSFSFTTNAGPAEGTTTNLLSRLQKENHKLTLEQVEAYLKANGRTALNLLAAYRTTGDRELLREAMAADPKNPQVAFEAVIDASASPEERARWLDSLKQASPDNSLPNYLAAADAFKAGNTELALQEVAAAAGKSRFSDFTLERLQHDEDLYLASGYSLAESKTIPGSQLLLPQLAQLKGLGNQLTELAGNYRSAGDEASAATALQMAIQLGDRYSEHSVGEPLVSQLVGLAIEYNALKTMSPDGNYPEGNGTVAERMAQIQKERDEAKALNESAIPLLARLTEQDWVSYIDHRLLFGEPEALRWVLTKYGTQ